MSYPSLPEPVVPVRWLAIAPRNPSARLGHGLALAVHRGHVGKRANAVRHWWTLAIVAAATAIAATMAARCRPQAGLGHSNSRRGRQTAAALHCRRHRSRSHMPEPYPIWNTPLREKGHGQRETGEGGIYEGEEHSRNVGPTSQAQSAALECLHAPPWPNRLHTVR
jgi:hypothetical protein